MYIVRKTDALPSLTWGNRQSKWDEIPGKAQTTTNQVCEGRWWISEIKHTVLTERLRKEYLEFVDLALMCIYWSFQWNSLTQTDHEKRPRDSKDVCHTYKHISRLYLVHITAPFQGGSVTPLLRLLLFCILASSRGKNSTESTSV